MHKYQFTDSKRVVVKIGSALLVDKHSGQLNKDWLSSLIEDVVDFYHEGVEILIVSSGAIALGRSKLQLNHKELTLEQKQASAAAGQIHLAHTYQKLLSEQKIQAAQILLTLYDCEHKKQFTNARNTLETLLQLGVIPIVNENDTVATTEIQYGDNDRLAARIAQMVNADMLVLLSDIDGLYTNDPRIDSSAKFIPVVKQLNSDIMSMAKDSSSCFGSGGMLTKLAAAKIALSSGCQMLIIEGKLFNPLKNFTTQQKGTLFTTETNPEQAKKTWFREHLNLPGSVVIDYDSVTALQEGKSLLPIDINRVEGQFTKGDVISILSREHQEIARGLSNYADDELRKMIGNSSVGINNISSSSESYEVVHSNNLVMTSSYAYQTVGKNNDRK